jgi:hypothetical protein
MSCEHEKVYDNKVLLTDPPQYPWICSKCGEVGRDRGEESSKETYDVIRKKFNK